MGRPSLFDNVREWIGWVAFALYLWSVKMTKEEFWVEQDKDAARGAGEQLEQLITAACGLIEYRQQAGPLNFQLEKADTFILRMRVALDAVGMLRSLPMSETSGRSK